MILILILASVYPLFRDVWGPSVPLLLFLCVHLQRDADVDKNKGYIDNCDSGACPFLLDVNMFLFLFLRTTKDSTAGWSSASCPRRTPSLRAGSPSFVAGCLFFLFLRGDANPHASRSFAPPAVPLPLHLDEGCSRRDQHVTPSPPANPHASCLFSRECCALLFAYARQRWTILRCSAVSASSSTAASSMLRWCRRRFFLNVTTFCHLCTAYFCTFVSRRSFSPSAPTARSPGRSTTSAAR
mmetsp:Transcript_30478/g.60301  ORF Transcript_30478/g.60301 Transcript_30478/m.60301 type:complete len:241 (-) Transcript_30478:491-1213(-)